MHNASLARLFQPRSVVIIGASDRGDKPGTRLVHMLASSGFTGPLYGVNRREFDYPGVTWLPSLADAPDELELACVAVGAEAATDAVEELAERGTKAAIVYSSGFSEAGSAGLALERRLIEASRRHGILLCGPNTAGVLSLHTGFVGTFTHALADGMPPQGSLMVITQSGSIGGIMLTRLRERRIGVSHWVSVGNGAALDLHDYLLAAADDDATSTVALFVEGLRDGPAFRAAAERCRAAGKTVIAYKAGVTPIGALAAQSHTGKVAGASRVYEGVFRQHGILRAETLNELTDLCMTANGLPARPANRQGAVLSVSGAGCTILADEITFAGLSLAPLSDATSDAIARVLPAYGQQANPVDLTGSALADLDILATVISAVSADPGVAYLVLNFATNADPDIARAILRSRSPRMPTVVVAPIAFDANRAMREMLASAGVPVFQEGRDAIRTLARIIDLPTASAPVEIRPGAAAAPPAATEGRWLEQVEVFRRLERLGIGVARTVRAGSPQQAAAAADEIDGSVVVKIDHPEVSHKSDVGGVRVGVPPAEVAEVCEQLRTAMLAAGHGWPDSAGWVIQPVVPSGAEVLVGLSRDPTFGATLTIGFGGTLVEMINEAATRALPITRSDIEDALASTALGTFLADYRGGRRDVAALVNLVERLTPLLHDDLVEFDLNPVIVAAAGQGCTVVDARMRTHTN